MSSTWSQKLRKLHTEKGYTVVCSVGPYTDEPVEFAPRYPTDREPWVLRSKTYRDPVTGELEILYRYSGRECHALPPEENSDGNP